MIWVAANSNLALVKYWGKVPGAANRAASGSLSVTLDGLTSVAGVEVDPSLGDDQVEWRPPGPQAPVRAFLDDARAWLGGAARFRVVLGSSFPVAAGLASSASTFAALATAVAAALGRAEPPAALAPLARLGSGSACRSLLGGFVEWRPEADEVVEVAPAEHWNLAILVAVTSEEPKRVSSRDGMARTAATSPYHRAWLEAGATDLEDVRAAIRERDLERLGRHAERNCLRMHAAALAADPPLLYWEPATVAVMREVWALRRRGVEACFSIDAGPQVKVLCRADAAGLVEAAVRAVPGVRRVLRSRPGGAPRLLDAAPAWLETAAARRAVGR